jgi:hypothetical protein
MTTLTLPNYGNMTAARKAALTIVANAHWSAIDMGTEFRKGYIQDSFEMWAMWSKRTPNKEMQSAVRYVLAQLGYTF